MVGSTEGGRGRSKDEAAGMMALHDALRSVCLSSDWTYSVFWTIRPRPRVRGGNGCKVGDDNGSLMLMWEDGFCRERTGNCLEEIDGEDPVRKAFSKMSIQLYNYGEGLLGKVASDKCHKWVFKEPADSEPNISNYWQSSFDALPSEWTDQFESGIQTIAVIQAGHGLLQLGSCNIITEDLHFVLRMRQMFESLCYQSGFYLSQLFSSNRNPSPSIPLRPLTLPTRQPPALLFNLGPFPGVPHRTNFPNPAARISRLPPDFDETHRFLQVRSETNAMDSENENDIKWSDGSSLFDTISCRADETNELLFNSDSLGDQRLGDHHQQHHHLVNNLEGTGLNSGLSHNANPNEFLSLDRHNFKMEASKFKRSLTLPTNMVLSSSSASMDQRNHQQVGYRNYDSGMYPDMAETLLE